MLPVILFYLFAAVAMFGALLTAFATNPRRAAAGLAIAMAAIAAIFLLLNAQFLAAVQLLVWGGPAIILFLLGLSIITPKPQNPLPKGQVLALAGLIAAMVIVLAWLFIRMPGFAATPAIPTSPSLTQLATALLSAHAPDGYLVIFELLSLLILTVMVGGAYLAKPRRQASRETPTVETLAPSPAAREKSRR